MVFTCSTVVLCIVLATYFDVWPSIETITDCLALLGTIISLKPCHSRDKEAEDESVVLDYWEQVLHDVTHGLHADTRQFPQLKECYYAGEYPSADDSHGPLVTTSQTKPLLDAAIPFNINWVKLDRLNRFLVLDEDGEVTVNVRSQSALFTHEPTLVPIIAQWYTAPWFVSERPLQQIRSALSEACPGLHHFTLTENRIDTEVGQHSHAPPTIVTSMSPPEGITNWRTHELLCCPFGYGWVVLRTIFVKKHDGNRVYFYCSIFPADMDPILYSAPFYDVWKGKASSLLAQKLEYIDVQELETYIVSSTVSNQWMVLQSPSRV